MLYVAKWPNGDISIVEAENLRDLYMRLDIEGDPGKAQFFRVGVEDDEPVHVSLAVSKPDSEGYVDYKTYNHSEVEETPCKWRKFPKNVDRWHLLA